MISSAHQPPTPSPIHLIITSNYPSKSQAIHNAIMALHCPQKWRPNYRSQHHRKSPASSPYIVYHSCILISTDSRQITLALKHHHFVSLSLPFLENHPSVSIQLQFPPGNFPPFIPTQINHYLLQSHTVPYICIYMLYWDISCIPYNPPR